MTNSEIVEAVETAAGWLNRPLSDSDWREIFEQVSLDYQVPIGRVKDAMRAHWNMVGVG